MYTFAIQISPDSKSAYFKDYVDVATHELKSTFDGLKFQHNRVGSLDFLFIEAEENQLPHLARLSFVQGCYRVHGNHLEPLHVEASFKLHEDFVFGSKYKGKTSERLTQLMLNVGLSAIGNPSPKKAKLLDPMCGRGTTLFWAARYGMKAKGIEQDPKALEDIRRNFKKWTKLHKTKHTLQEGTVGKSKKKGHGKFLELNVVDTHLKFIIGDARDARRHQRRNIQPHRERPALRRAALYHREDTQSSSGH